MRLLSPSEDNQLPFIARSISNAKWETKEGFDEDEIQADAVTADLKTQSNSISFWKYDTTLDGDLDSIALAICAGRERIDKIDLVWVSQESVKGAGIQIEETDGATPVSSLTDKHVDITRLDLNRLAELAKLMAQAFGNKQRKRIQVPAVKKLLIQAVQTGALSLDNLNDSLKEKVRKILPTD